MTIAGTMSVVAEAFFVLARLFSPSRGLAANLLRRRRNRRSFSRALLARLGASGARATEEDLGQQLGWEEGQVSRVLGDALRAGLVLRPSAEEVVLTRKG